MWSDIIICNTLNRYFCDIVMRKFQKPGFSGCPMPYLGPYHLPLFKGSPQMLSTGSNRFERWQGNSDIIAFAFLFDAIICRIKIHFLVIMTSSDSVSISVISQDGYLLELLEIDRLGEVSLHEQCRVDFTKMHPQRAPKSMFSCRSILFHL